MAEDQRLIRIEISAEDGDLCLEALADELDAIKKGVHALDSERTNSVVIRYRVVDQSRENPYRWALSPELLSGAECNLYESFDTFIGLVKTTVSTSRIPEFVSKQVAKSIRRVVKPVGTAVRSVFVSTPTHTVDVNEAVEITSPAKAATLSYCGRLTGVLIQIRLDEENKDRWFDLRPMPGSNTVRCYFPAERDAEAKDALNTFVELKGMITFNTDTLAATKIVVDTIAPLPSDPPDILSLKGNSPECTDGKPTDEFLKDRQNGWD